MPLAAIFSGNDIEESIVMWVYVCACIYGFTSIGMALRCDIYVNIYMMLLYVICLCRLSLSEKKKGGVDIRSEEKEVFVVCVAQPLWLLAIVRSHGFLRTNARSELTPSPYSALLGKYKHPSWAEGA